MNKNIGLLGRKIGMTQIFDAEGQVVPVTVIEAGPCPITQVKSMGGKDGYEGIQLGFAPQKPQRLTKAQVGHFAKASVAPTKVLREFRLKDASAYSPGQVLSAGEVFSVGQKVDVTGTSKGRGFSGVMKRHNFRGFIRSHGTHEFFRHGGSIGTRLTPGHVGKGMKMPGQHGNARTTIHGLTVVRVDADDNLVYIRGGVPGRNGGLVSVRGTSKGQG